MGLAFYVVILLVLMFFGTPIGHSLLISTVAYVIFFSDQSLLVVCKQIIGSANTFTVLALPFFILLGNLLGRAGITQRLVKLAHGMVGHTKGSLAQVNNVASMLLACVQGVATAGVAATGSILIPAMKKEGYKPGYAAALTAAAATIGPIIPPSITFVVYGVASDTSVGKLFMAGVVPGILLGLFLIVYTAIKARRGKEYAGERQPFSKRLLWEGVKAGGLALIIPVIILGGIISGFFTATESGTFAVIATIILGMFVYRTLKPRDIWASVKETCTMLGNFGIVFAGAGAFGWMLAREGAAQMLAGALMGITENPIIIMLLMNIVLLIAGCFMDTLTNVILFTPIFLPIALAYGYSPIHFGVIMVLNLTLGTVTPPLGTVMFVASGIAKVKLEVFMKEMLPLYFPMVLLLLVIIFVPSLSTWLPALVIG